jgi:PhoPQ-activated pathogenicity-related protein
MASGWNAFPVLVHLLHKMKSLFRPLILVWILMASAQAAVLPARSGSPATALDRYVAAPDPSYHWEVVSSTPFPGGKVHALDLVSQHWKTTHEVDHPEWRHWLMVVVPDAVDTASALLFITGGSVGKEAPKPTRELVEVARASRSVVAELHQVPAQPLVLGGDGQPRSEDDFIAYTWDKFLRTGEETWPARLPMTKAAVRAMDAVTAFCATPGGGSKKVDSFVVAGGSKRGWTTWTTAAVDPRVVGICPIVIDVLNFGRSMEHHYQAYGEFAPSVGDYTRHHIMDWMGTSEMEALCAIEDPYSYRARMTLPKLIMNATGDQYFLPDSSQFYFDELPGPKYLRYVPNADHSLSGSDAYLSVLAWHDAVIHQRALPRFNWTYDAAANLAVSAQDKPVQVLLWQATNPKARDFRLEKVGPIWKSSPVEDTGSGAFVYKAAAPQPIEGWSAYFMELTFNLGGPVPLKLTTPVRVVPDTLPHTAPKPTPPQGYLHR